MSSLVIQVREKLFLSLAVLLLFATCMAFSTSQSVAAQESATADEVVVLDVQGMSWEYCSFAVSEALYNLEGVKDAYVDLYYATATVTYDSAIVDVASMIAATNEIGYTSTVQKVAE